MVTMKLLLLAMVVIISYPSGQAQDDGCVKVPLIKDFNVDQVMGGWHAQETGSENEMALKCLYYVLTLNKTNTGSIVTVRRVYNAQKSNRAKTEPFKLLQIGNTSEYRTEWEGQTRRIWTVATDYKSWSVWYICVPWEENKVILTITTRDEVPSNATMEKARDFARKLGFKMDGSHMKPVDHTGCK